MRIALHGATGRMGQAITRVVASRAVADVEIVGAVASRTSASLGRDVGEVAGVGTLGVAIGAEPPAALLGADVVIDFSTSAALPALLNAVARARLPLLSGTTRLDDRTEAALDEAARGIAVLSAPNTSLGVQVLLEIAEAAVRRLGPGFDVEIVEAHHRGKIDAPSGTAVRLAGALTRASERARQVRGRDGNVGPRPADEIGVHAVRGGDVIGDHTVLLLGPGERLELTHRATSRDLFAHGALRAARFLLGRRPGRYTMADVLGG